MRLRLFHTALLSLFFLALALFLFLIGISSSLAAKALIFVQKETLFLLLLSLSFFLIAAAYFVHVMMESRKSFYYLKSGPNAIELDLDLFKNHLERYLKPLFPSSRFFLKLEKGTLHLTLDLPSMPKCEQPHLLERMQEEIRENLLRDLGFQGKLTLKATFEK